MMSPGWARGSHHPIYDSLVGTLILGPKNPMWTLMLRLAFAGIIAYLVCGTSFAQDIGVDDYVTGMTIVGKPDAGPSCPPIVWFVEPETPAARAGIPPGERLLAG